MTTEAANPTAPAAPRLGGGTLDAARPSEHLPGQLIVRFKKSAVEAVAANPVPMTARASVAAAAMPDEVSGPLKLLREEAGMVSVKPLFVQSNRLAKPALRTMGFAAVHGALASTATAPRRETLSGFELITVRDQKVAPGLLKRLNASRAIEFAEQVPNRWLCSADPLVNRQWALRAIRWFDAERPDAKAVHVAVLDSGVDSGHPDLSTAVRSYRHDGNNARDFLGHGTHVSGIIAATIDNAIGIAGVANCRLHCWKRRDEADVATGAREGRSRSLNSTAYQGSVCHDTRL
jgi:hypothetical protein